MDVSSIAIAAVFVMVSLFTWVSFRTMKDENIQQFQELGEDHFMD